jgi:putative transposase
MKPLFENQMEIFNLVNEVTNDTKFSPMNKNSWLTYNQLDYIFKESKNVDYYNLPAHINQQVMKMVVRDYKGYFESLKEYKQNPTKFLGQPKLPRYKKSGGLTTTILTNQVCVIKDNKYLKFPKTKNVLNILKCGEVGTLKEVRVKPHFKGFVIDVVMEQKFPNEIEMVDNDTLLKQYKEYNECSERALAIDIGLSNLCACINNFGEQPFLIKGTILKSANHYYNKKMAYLRSIAKTINSLDYTKQMHRLTTKRNNIIKDYMHKTSNYIVQYAMKHNVTLVIVGHNKEQKQKINLGTMNNQNFVSIPTNILINQLRYKLNKVGIVLAKVEESYTSQASFVDNDTLPTYCAKNNDNDENNEQENYVFSGKRVKRGLYQTKDNLLVNADINGAANILRKVFPKVTQWVSGIVDMPFVANVLQKVVFNDLLLATKKPPLQTACC